MDLNESQLTLHTNGSYDSILFCFEWTAKDVFRHLNKLDEYVLVSLLFPLDVKLPKQWQLILNSRISLMEAKVDKVSIYMNFLPMEKPFDRQTINYLKFIIKSSAGCDYTKTEYQPTDYPTGNQNLGPVLVIEFEDLVKRRNDLMPGDDITVIIEGELDVHFLNFVLPPMQDLTSFAPAPTIDMVWLLFSDLMSDVTFVVQGEKIPAHKPILGSRSSVFADVFSGEETSVLHMPDTSMVVVCQLLFFIYTGKTPPLIHLETPALLQQANRFNLPYLKSLCERSIMGFVTSQDMIPSLALALQTKAPELRDFCTWKIAAMMPVRVPSSHGKQLYNLHEYVLEEIFVKHKALLDARMNKGMAVILQTV